MEEVINEMGVLKNNGYDVDVINESFFEWLSGLVGGTVSGIPGSVPQLGKEYVVDWFLKTLGLDTKSYLANVVSTAIGNISFKDYGKLFTDCRFTSEVLSQSVAEAFFKQMQSKSESASMGVGGILVGLLRNSVADTLVKDKNGIIGGMVEGLNSFICGKLTAVSDKMEQTKQEITDKALS